LDPHHIFNPGKIVDAPPMDVQLRYTAPHPVPEFDTILNFDETGGIYVQRKNAMAAVIAERVQLLAVRCVQAIWPVRMKEILLSQSKHSPGVSYK
jgi:hypothetical protein